MKKNIINFKQKNSKLSYDLEDLEFLRSEFQKSSNIHELAAIHSRYVDNKNDYDLLAIHHIMSKSKLPIDTLEQEFKLNPWRYLANQIMNRSVTFESVKKAILNFVNLNIDARNFLRGGLYNV